MLISKKIKETKREDNRRDKIPKGLFPNG